MKISLVGNTSYLTTSTFQGTGLEGEAQFIRHVQRYVEMAVTEPAGIQSCHIRGCKELPAQEPDSERKREVEEHDPVSECGVI